MVRYISLEVKITKNSCSRLKDDHLYTLPPGVELRERFEGAMMRVEQLESQLQGFEKFKKTMRERLEIQISFH